MLSFIVVIVNQIFIKWLTIKGACVIILST
jgi:hypothetical protein